MDTATFVIGIVLGVAAGAGLAFLWLRGKVAIAEMRAAAAETASRRANETFQAAADAALRSNHAAFLETAKATLGTVHAQMVGEMAQKQTAIEGVVRPLADTLGRLETQVRSFESERSQMFGGMRERMDHLARETVALSNALKAPQSRGRWGELTLRRVAELAGMARQCDFYEQETYENNGSRLRPDMVVRLPGGRTLVVDAKVPLSAYQEAANANDDATRRAALQKHAQQVARHVEQLSSRQYWNQFQPAPELVILFLPGDHFLSAALEASPSLLEDAIARKVLLATPVTLISALAGVAHGWRQQQFAENAVQIQQLAVELSERIQALYSHYAGTGIYLQRAVEAYNKSVASWESRLLPCLRRIRELGAVHGDEPVSPEHIDLAPRAPKAFVADSSA